MIISTKATFRISARAERCGLVAPSPHSRRRGAACAASAPTTSILFQLHGFDALTPIEETLRTLDDLVRAGKIRYIGCSNFSGWHLMKSLAISEKYGLARHVAHQAYYSLIGREYEWELMPLALDQKVGTVVWSPLGWGRLTGKIRRGQPLPKESRLHETAADGPAGARRASLSRRRRARRQSPTRPARPCRRSRSTGCCSGRPLPLSSSARATRSSSRQNLGAHRLEPDAGADVSAG